MRGPLFRVSAVVTASAVLFATSPAFAQSFDAPPIVAGPPGASDAAPATTPSPADAFVTVHLDADEPVDLESNVGGSWKTVCTSPCDRALPSGGAYRINGSGIRTSKSFRLTPGTTRYQVETGSSTGHTLSVVVVVVGVIGFAPGLGVTAAVAGGLFLGLILICPLVDAFSSKTTYTECLGDIGSEIGKAYAEPIVWIPAAAGAVLVTGGVIGLATSRATTATPVTGSAPTATRAPEWQVPIGGATRIPALANAPVVPVLRFAF